MEITITYNGDVARCRITSKNTEIISDYNVPYYFNTLFDNCDKMTQLLVLTAFEKVMLHFEDLAKYELNSNS